MTGSYSLGAFCNIYSWTPGTMYRRNLINLETAVKLRGAEWRPEDCGKEYRWKGGPLDSARPIYHIKPESFDAVAKYKLWERNVCQAMGQALSEAEPGANFDAHVYGEGFSRIIEYNDRLAANILKGMDMPSYEDLPPIPTTLFSFPYWKPKFASDFSSKDLLDIYRRNGCSIYLSLGIREFMYEGVTAGFATDDMADEVKSMLSEFKGRYHFTGQMPPSFTAEVVDALKTVEEDPSGMISSFIRGVKLGAKFVNEFGMLMEDYRYANPGHPEHEHYPVLFQRSAAIQ